MTSKITGMSDEELTKIWEDLSVSTWPFDEMYDKGAGISMNDWAENIYGEMCIRGLPC